MRKSPGGDSRLSEYHPTLRVCGRTTFHVGRAVSESTVLSPHEIIAGQMSFEISA